MAVGEVFGGLKASGRKQTFGSGRALSVLVVQRGSVGFGDFVMNHCAANGGGTDRRD